MAEGIFYSCPQRGTGFEATVHAVDVPAQDPVILPSVRRPTEDFFFAVVFPSFRNFNCRSWSQEYVRVGVKSKSTKGFSCSRNMFLSIRDYTVRGRLFKIFKSFWHQFFLCLPLMLKSDCLILNVIDLRVFEQFISSIGKYYSHGQRVLPEEGRLCHGICALLPPMNLSAREVVPGSELLGKSSGVRVQPNLCAPPHSPGAFVLPKLSDDDFLGAGVGTPTWKWNPPNKGPAINLVPSIITHQPSIIPPESSLVGCTPP